MWCQTRQPQKHSEASFSLKHHILVDNLCVCVCPCPSWLCLVVMTVICEWQTWLTSGRAVCVFAGVYFVELDLRVRALRKERRWRIKKRQEEIKKKRDKMGAEWEVRRSDEQKEKETSIKTRGSALLERTEQETEWGLFTSFRAFSSLGLLSSTFSLDCCFSFLSSAVTERHKKRKRDEEKREWAFLQRRKKKKAIAEELFFFHAENY